MSNPRGRVDGRLLPCSLVPAGDRALGGGVTAQSARAGAAPYVPARGTWERRTPEQAGLEVLAAVRQ